MNKEKIHNYIDENGLNVEKVMNDFSNYIYTIVRNSNSNLLDEDLEEIVLDVVLTVWKNQNKLDINKPMSSYISGVTRILILKKYREISLFDSLDNYEGDLIDFQNIELQFIENEKNKQIIKEINKLSNDEREIFERYYYEEQNIKDIANNMFLSESNVKSKLFRIRKKLKKYLKKGGYI